MLYVVILIVPLFYLLVLDVASFFISEARGEKLSFKVTVLLSISVLLLILQDMLPSTEDNLPLIGELPAGHTGLSPELGFFFTDMTVSASSFSHLLRCNLCPGGDKSSGGHADELFN